MALGNTSTTNNQQGLSAKSTVNQKQEYLNSTNGSLNIIGTVTTSSGSLPTAPLYGQTTVSVTNTAIQLPSNVLTVGVIVQALAANTNNVVIGDASVTTSNGFQLQPGQATSVAVGNTNDLYVNGTAADGVCFIGS